MEYSNCFTERSADDYDEPNYRYGKSKYLFISKISAMNYLCFQAFFMMN